MFVSQEKFSVKRVFTIVFSSFMVETILFFPFQNRSFIVLHYIADFRFLVNS